MLNSLPEIIDTFVFYRGITGPEIIDTFVFYRGVMGPEIIETLFSTEELRDQR